MGLIGGAIGAIGNLFGGFAAAKTLNKAYNAARDNLDSQSAKNESWYNRRYNELATQRADAQDLLTRTEDSIRERNRQAAGMAAVAGGTDESVAAAKSANNAALAQAASQITAQGDQRKDAIESQYMRRDAELTDKVNNLELQKANAKATAITDAAQQLNKITDQIPL